jgi:hypothetical protein
VAERGWRGADEGNLSEFRTEAGCLGQVEVPATKLWGTQTQHLSISQDLLPRDDRCLTDRQARLRDH